MGERYKVRGEEYNNFLMGLQFYLLFLITLNFLSFPRHFLTSGENPKL